MNTKINIINKIISISSFIFFVFGIIRMYFSYGILPDNIVVHFASNGSFDVVVNKSNMLYVAYPYLISFIILIFLEIVNKILKKIKIGFKVNTVGEEKIKLATMSFLNINKFLWIFFFSFVWSNSVITQHYLNTSIPVILMIIGFVSVIIFIFLVIYIRRKNSIDSKLRR